MPRLNGNQISNVNSFINALEQRAFVSIPQEPIYTTNSASTGLRNTCYIQSSFFDLLDTRAHANTLPPSDPQNPNNIYIGTGLMDQINRDYTIDLRGINDLEFDLRGYQLYNDLIDTDRKPKNINYVASVEFIKDFEDEIKRSIRKFQKQIKKPEPTIF